MESLKHQEIVIPKKNPFENCKLERKKYAEILTSIIENSQEGFVLAIDNEWGTGKTTFVKMWEQDLKHNNGFKTIYFNAWENDFENNPLIALIGELEQVDKNSTDKFEKVVQNAATISKNIVPSLLKAFLNKYIDSDVLVETLSNTSKGLLTVFEDDVKSYSNRKKSIQEFKDSFSNFVKSESKDKPLVFIIDELDRCRPNYAVLLLEQIKHLFSVPNVVFVLSIDKIQLGNAIRGVYGSEKLDSNEYLRRFIDIEYSIPKPLNGQFIDYLYNYFKFDAFFNAQEKKSSREFKHDKDNFLYTSKILLQNLTLRQKEKIFAHTRLTLKTLNFNNYTFPILLVFLVYLKNIHQGFYNELSNKQWSIEDVQNEFYEIIKSFRTNKTDRLFCKIEAHLLKFYENSKTPDRSYETILYEQDKESRKYNLKLHSKINDKYFLDYLTDHTFQYDYSRIELSYLTSKINLTEYIKTN